MTGQAGPLKAILIVLQFSLMRVPHWEITQNLNSKQKWPATDLKSQSQMRWLPSSWEAGGSYTWSGHTLAHHRGWRACRAEKPLTRNLPQPSIESYTVFLGLDLWGGGKRSSMIKCKQKTDFAESAHSALGCVWCLRSLGGSKTGRGAGTAPALGTGHLPGDGVRPRPDQGISPNTSLLLLWHRLSSLIFSLLPGLY